MMKATACLDAQTTRERMPANCTLSRLPNDGAKDDIREIFLLKAIN